MFGCGEMATNLKISGLRISNCIHISAPNENPITQLSFEFGLLLCTKSKAAAASANSPSPFSNFPHFFLRL